MSENLNSNTGNFRKDTIYKWVVVLGVITLPFLLIAIIILITNIRAKTGKYKLILLLSISTFFCTLSYIIPWKKVQENKALCFIQGNLMLMFETSQYLISMLVGYHTRYVIINKNGSDMGFMNIQLFTYSFIGFGIPLILVTIANIKNGIGYCSPWCWIVDSKGENNLDFIYRIIAYFIMVGSQLLNIFFSISIIANLNNDPSISIEQKKRHKSLIYKMLRYPICLLICVVPGLINRISSFGEEEDIDKNTMSLLSSIATILLSSSGFFILIIYGLTLNTIRLLKESCNKAISSDDFLGSTNEIFDTISEDI